ncbi:WD40 repeat-like protein [Plenodomus tracheiphilus IPT5]|uniref:WD40 repeat-like protein n=1 Tax=Plenodomus tracheiphilus IPT5 TaxID=1408161 RepID=A0A6A7BAF6_9PLEO|nr:WD40 repeat-like protein [Plenodomus tracheiphilus IPT5]
MADATPQLKRKNEEATPQRKSKKQRKSEAASIQVEAATPKEQSKAAVQDGEATKSENVAVESTTAKPIPKVVKVTTDAHAPSTETPSKSSQKKSKKEQKEQKKDTPAKAEAQDTAEDKALAVIEPLTQAQMDKALKKKEYKEIKKQKAKGGSKWVASPMQGGWFLPTDPIFSADEKYLLLAQLKSLQIYSTETSLLANVLPIGGKGVLTTYALSATKSNLVYVADSDGLITLWDWVNGTKIGRWDIGAPVRNMAVVSKPDSDEDLVFCHETGDKTQVLNVHALRTKSQASKTELKRVLKTGSTIRGVQVLLQGRYVILRTNDSIMVGKRIKPTHTAVQDFEYIWREFSFSKRVTTFSAYHRERESVKGKKPIVDQRDVLDIVVGEETGVVFLFEDILATFAAIESTHKGRKDKTDNAESLRPKRLHWHRDAVGAVKWSLDGNYVISGGEETVLTIWQLATGKPQHLPHLTAAIENVVVSPSGTSYALTLANNSVIVLSTTELEAKANIIGVQSRRVDHQQQSKDSNKTDIDIFHHVPMAVNPALPNEVLLAVPSSQPRHKYEGLRPEPYLQTFDLANHRAKSRQALTRNNVTEPNVAPEGGKIKEPGAKFIQISHDGEWLATVDEWVPPASDTGFLNEGIPEFNEEERLNRREVYLKIWRRDEAHDQWKLDSRLDAPHFFEDVCGNGRVFDLVADPTGAGFATVGEDHVVKIWRPKTRLREGVVVRGADEGGLVTWSLDRSIPISDKLDVLEGSQQSLPPRTSRLAFSPDGSVLAVAISWASDSDFGVTHLIDTHSASIRRSMTEIDVTALSNLGFVGHHLVFVADSLTVWDMILDQPVYSASLKTSGVDRIERMPLIRFAVNNHDNTFAVALPHFDKATSSASKSRRITSTIAIYDLNHNAPLWSNTSPHITLALASRKSERGYIALDSVSCLKTISPSAVALQLPTPPPEEKSELRASSAYKQDGEEESFDTRIEAITLPEDLTQDLNEDVAVLNAQRLQDVLDNGQVPPPPQGLFSAVLALVGRPGRVGVAA